MSRKPLPFPQVAVEFMNRDHAEFAGLRERLLDALSGDVHNATIDGLLAELVDHTARHFADEERMMVEASFPPYEVHKAEHDHVLAEMQARGSRWSQDTDVDALRRWIEKDVGDWFIGHVGSMDLVTAAFVERKGRR